MQRRVASGGQRWLVVLLVSLALLGGLGAVWVADTGPSATTATGSVATAPGESTAIAPDGSAPAANVTVQERAAVGSSEAPSTSPSTAASRSATTLPSAIVSSGSAASPSTTSPSTPASTTSAVQSDAPIVEQVSYGLLPADPDRVEARITYEIPDNVGTLSFQIVHGNYEVESLDGFERTDDGRFRWDGSGDGGAVTISHAPGESFRPEPGDTQHVGGTDEWAVVTRPQTQTNFSYSWDEPALEYRLDASTDGYAGTRFAFLGDHETYSETVSGERITLVMPNAAEPASSPDQILNSVAYASDRLRFGNTNDEVVLIAAPTGEIEWGPPGLAIGADARIAADASVDDRINVWVHEYVHTRQYRDAEIPRGDAVADDAHWVIEGSAEYYAALTSLEQGRIDFATFRQILERGTDPTVSDAVLADRESWATNDAEYAKGALVVGAIDRQLRASSNGSVTFQAVVNDWNQAETFTAADLEASVTENGNEAVGEFARTHTRTSATPDTWDRQTHDEYFDVRLPRFDYRVVDDPPFSVSGPFRTGSLSEPLVVGENVSVEIRVENVGDVAGDYRASLVVGEFDHATATGSLGPGESETVSLTQRVTRPGNVRIVAGGVSRTVGVREPATPRVTRIDPNPRSPTTGETVDLRVTVSNPDSRPAAGNVTVTVDGEPIGTEAVRLAPRENATVELSTTFEETGTYDVATGELELQIPVREPGPLESLPTMAILGGVIAVLVVLGSALLLRWR